jgi:hypothetical protein
VGAAAGEQHVQGDPAAQTLVALFTNVQLRQVQRLKNATLHLILGSTFAGLKAASSNSGISNLAKNNGGITGNTNVCSDSAAFAGPDGDQPHGRSDSACRHRAGSRACLPI